MTSLSLFCRSLRHACRGLVDVTREEQSFRLQLLISGLVISVSWLLPLVTWERILLILLCGAVMVLELINSIMERFVDALQPRLSTLVRQVKDMMAGAVFLTAGVAGVVGFMIFYPHFYSLICDILVFCKGR